MGRRLGGSSISSEAATQPVSNERENRPKRNCRSVRTYVKRLRCKLGDNADSPKYIVAEPRIGYRMPKGETQEREET